MKKNSIEDVSIFDHSIVARLQNHLKRRALIPFCGSGISVDSGLPTWENLAQTVYTYLESNANIFGLDQQQSLNAAGLLLKNQDLIGFFSRVKEDFGAILLQNALRNAFSDDAIPNELHHLILDLRTPGIITTNFDLLFEKAFEERKILYRKFYYFHDDRLCQLVHQNAKQTYLLKLHGDVEELNRVISGTRDYNKLLMQYKALELSLKALFMSRNILYIGYSLKDPDIHAIYESLWQIFGEQMPESYILVSRREKESIVNLPPTIQPIIFDDETCTPKEATILLLQSISIKSDKKDISQRFSAVEGIKQLKFHCSNTTGDESNLLGEAKSIIRVVPDSQRKLFVRRLVEQLDSRLLFYAIIAVTEIYEKISVETLKSLIADSWGSKPIPLNAPVREMVRVRCQPEILTTLGIQISSSRVEPVRAEEIYLGRYPVTNLDFEYFYPKHKRSSFSRHDLSPVVNINWFEALNFAFWADLTLPTMLEWLSAAAPPEWPNKFQFGPMLNTEMANYDRYYNKTTEINKFKKYPSHCGCLDMSGNVWEWINDWYSENTSISPSTSRFCTFGPVRDKIVLGGAWNSPPWELALGNIHWLPVFFKGENVGFRCARLSNPMR